MKNLKSFWGKYKSLVLEYGPAILILFLILVINVQPGKIIMGLDNASPWFDVEVTLHRILSSENFFEYGGLLFSLPFTALRLLSIPPWLISQLFVWGAFITGFVLLFNYFSHTLKRREGLSIIITLAILSNLVSIWIFSQPILLFVAAFAGVPAVLTLLRDGQKSSLSKTLCLIGLFYFFTCSINPVAFVLYLAETLVITWALSPKQNFSKVLLKGGTILVIWIAISQMVMLGTGQKSDFISELREYAKINVASPLSQEVTQSLRIAEQKNNSLVNVLRFATGWVELNDIESKDIFAYSRLYAGNLLFILLGLVPITCLIVFGLKNAKWRLENKKLIFVYAIAVVMTTSYALIFLGYIPYIRDALRWISSKTWPLLFILGNILFLRALEEVHARKKYFLAIVAILMGIYGFPWATGKLVNQYGYVNMPTDYINFPQLESTEILAVYPTPQKLFFRSYPWGYYGTDFLSYLTKARIVDGSSVTRPIEAYAKLGTKDYYFITEDLGFTPEECLERQYYVTDDFKISYCAPHTQPDSPQ